LPKSKLEHAAVLSHRDAGRGYRRIVLDAPGIAKTARPGQFVMLRVSGTRDPLLARPFGIAATNQKRSIELYYRVVGRGTNMLAAVEAGHCLAVQGPLGNGFPLPEKGVTPVLVAGGSGFPPLLSLASRLRTRAHVFLGARDCECLPPASVIKTFKQHAKRVYIATDNGSHGVQGQVTGPLDSFLAASKGTERIVLYACGPRAMLAAVSRIAAAREVPCYVSLEERMACGLGACMGCSVPVVQGGYRRVCKEGPVFDSREIEWKEQVVLPVPHKK